MIRQSLNKLKLIQLIAMILILLFTFVSLFISYYNSRQLKLIDDGEKYARQQEINIHEIAYTTLSYVHETDADKPKKILDSKNDFQLATEQLLRLNLLDQAVVDQLLLAYAELVDISDQVVWVTNQQYQLKSEIVKFSGEIRNLFSNEREIMLTLSQTDMNNALLAYEQNLLSLLKLLDLDTKDESLALQQTIDLLQEIQANLATEEAKMALSVEQTKMINAVHNMHSFLDGIANKLVNTEKTNSQQISLLSSAQKNLDDLLDLQIQSQLESDYNDAKETIEFYEYIELINILALLLILAWSSIKVRSVNTVITKDLNVLIDQTKAIGSGQTISADTITNAGNKGNEFKRISLAMVSMQELIRETSYSKEQLETLLNCIGNFRIMVHADGSLSDWSNSLLNFLGYHKDAAINEVTVTNLLGHYIDFDILGQMIFKGLIKDFHWHLKDSKNTYQAVVLTGLRIDENRLVLIGNQSCNEPLEPIKHITEQGQAFGVLVLDDQQVICEANSVATKILQIPYQQLIHKNLEGILKKIHSDKPLNLNISHSGQQKPALTEICFHSNLDSSKRHITVKAVSLNCSKEKNMTVLILDDFTALRQSQEKIRVLAYTDALTGLPNRSKLIEYTKEAILTSHQNHSNIALLFIDLDNFKNINDAFGHESGDLMLKKIAQRLSHQVPEHNLIARIGGDEFCIVLNSMDDDACIERVVDSCLTALAEPIFIKSVKIFPACSIGIALYPKDGKNSNSLLKSADIAMYAAKEAGKNRSAYYSNTLAEAATKRVNFESMLQKQIREDGYSNFEIFYQAKVDINVGRIIGFEALIRFNHTRRGVIFPDSFIPVIERIGLINDLDYWVLKNACHFILQLHKQGYNDLSLAVNISPTHFKNKDFVSRVSHILRELNYPAHLLELEITENVFSEPSEQIENFKAISKLGVKIAIDDFGTGYSSLSQLQQLPINTLKIDKIFVKDIGKSDQADCMIKSIKDMTDSFDLSTVVEGVETAQQLDTLKRYNYNLIQGYYFSRPIPSAKIISLLSKKLIK